MSTPEPHSALPYWYVRKWSEVCPFCNIKGIARIGGFWCPRCRMWLNDPRAWRLLV